MNPFEDINYDDSPRTGVFCVGNGKAAAYIGGGEIRQLFGPCYSAPSAFSISFCEKNLKFSSYRRRKAVIWRTEIAEADGDQTGSIVDFCVPDKPVFIRRIRLKRPMTFTIDMPFGGKLNAFADRGVRYSSIRQSILSDIPTGSRVFGENYTDKELFVRLILPEGSVIDGDKLTIPEGDSELVFVAGEEHSPEQSSFASCMEECDIREKVDTDIVYDECVDYWYKRFSEIRSLPDDITAVAEDTAAVLLSQTSVQGGVLAGSHYHLAYGRDMYGVIRGYIALGMFPQARRCIDYFVRQFREKGGVPNAGGMGMSCSHCHENDDCEQTGYYLLELTDLYSACGDPDFLAERADYVRYLLEAQEKRLFRGMIPFNGDETYIAGGLMPRDCIDHGSMEATALYITGAERILDEAEKSGFLDKEYIRERRAAAREAKRLFASNFLSDDGSVLYVNAPSRLDGAFMKKYRHGICLGCGGMRYLALTGDKTYLCADCFGKKSVSAGSARYPLACASLMLGFIGSDAIPESKIAESAISGYDEYRRKTGKNVVGYEAGLLLYVLSGVKVDENIDISDIAVEVERLRRCSGGAGVWVEYYLNGEVSPSCCPYRPWESAINLCGLIKYAEKHEN